MAATKTSAETAATALTGAELIRGVQGGMNVKATVEQFRDYGIKSGVPFTAMPALAVNVALPGNSYSATGDVTFTYSNATPAEGTSTFLRIASDGTARTITIPTTWSLARGGNITSLVVPANTVLQVKLQYVGSRWEVIGDPPATVGTGSFVLETAIDNAKKRIIGFCAGDGVNALATGKVSGFFAATYAGTITGWNMTVDAGTAKMKAWKIATGTAKPTNANSINTAGVGISSGTHIRSSTVTDFTSVAVAIGDIFAFEISEVATAKEISGAIEITTS